MPSVPTGQLSVKPSQSQPLTSRHCGLSMAEILIVVVIVATIVALTYPAIQRSRKAAYLATATANLRQIYVAGELYRNDHDLNEFPHQSKFSNSKALQGLHAHRHDPYEFGLGNAVRKWGLSTPIDPKPVYSYGETPFIDSVIHFRDIFRGELSLWPSGDPNAVVMVMHHSYETTRCPPIPVGVWGSHLRVTDSGSIITHWVDFKPERVPTGGQGIFCSPAKWFK